MQSTQALVLKSFRIQVIHCANQRLTRLTLYFVVQLIRMHIVPLEGSLGADNADVLAAHVTCVNCRCPHTANCAVLITHQDVSIVLQRCAGLDEALAVAQQLLQLQLRADQLGHIEGVGGQVAKYKGRAGLCRINTPLLTLSLLVAGRVASETMCVAEVYHGNLTNVAVQDHGTHLAQQVETGEAVGYANDLALFLSQLLDLFAFLNLEEQRLLADYMQAGFQSGLADLKVLEVRGCDVNSLDAVLALCFLSKHGLVIRVEALLIHVQVLAEVYAAGEVQVERCSLEYERGVVAHSAQTMLVANAGSAAAAYDTPTERTINFLFTDKHNVFLLSSICKKVFDSVLYCLFRCFVKYIQQIRFIFVYCIYFLTSDLSIKCFMDVFNKRFCHKVHRSCFL